MPRLYVLAHGDPAWRGFRTARPQVSPREGQRRPESALLIAMRHTTVLLGLLGLAACQSTPSVDVTPRVTSSPRLAALNPRDIAVLPVHDNSVNQGASWLLSEMRASAAGALPKRRYSPMALKWVDERLAVAVDQGAGKLSSAGS